jgi:hypothetical protein
VWTPLPPGVNGRSCLDLTRLEAVYLPTNMFSRDAQSLQPIALQRTQAMNKIRMLCLS